MIETLLLLLAACIIAALAVTVAGLAVISLWWLIGYSVDSVFNDSFDKSFKRGLREQYGYTEEGAEEELRVFLSENKRG